eukprot:Awhi_evm1s13836
MFAFSKLQGGFRSGNSCILHAISLHHLIYKVRGISIFLDLQTAFDTVHRKILYQKLLDMKINAKLILLLLSLFEECRSIILNNRSSSSIDRLRGLLQGSILSPTLFNIYINVLAEDLCSKFPGTPSNPFPALLIADDIALHLPDLATAKKALLICENWAKTHRIQFNFDKSKVLLHFKFKALRKNIILTLGGKNLLNTDSYEYLGVPFNAYGINMSLHLESLLSKAKKALTSLKFVGFTNHLHNSMLPKHKLTSYITFVKPCPEYGLFISLAFPFVPIDELELFQFSCVKTILASNLTFGRHLSLYSICGIPTLRQRILELQNSFTNHILNMTWDNPFRFSSTNILTLVQSTTL